MTRLVVLAWVLWQLHTGPPERWAVIDAFETKRECDFNAKRLEEKMKGPSYMCLPSGTDPRPR